MPHTVVFLVFPDFLLLDLAGPLAALRLATEIAGAPAYQVRIVSRRGGVVRSICGGSLLTERPGAQPFDTLVIAGGPGAVPAAGDTSLIALVRSLAVRSHRTVSVCTGAFLLAQSGVLDGRRATTHWRYATELQQRYPDVRVNAERIFVKDGSVWSSAGITAGIDLTLALIEEDLGIAVAKSVAQYLVVYRRRPGGQSQFSAMLELEPRSDNVRRALTFAREHLCEKLSLERLAAAACLSPRHFGRVFRAEAGETPRRAVERLRVEAARVRVEAGVEPIEAIAATVGFADPETMRRSFLRVFGRPPQEVKRRSRAERGW